MTPMTKNMWRDIRGNKGRFIAIVLIIFLGSLIFVGVRAAGPGLNDSMAKTVTDEKLSDVSTFSTTGFTKKDVQVAQQVSGAKAEVQKFKYVLGGRNQDAIALYGLDHNLKQNRWQVASGRLPKGDNEIMLDEKAKAEDDYKLGQTFRFAASAKLKNRSYKIVGFANSPRDVDNSQRGSAPIGDGSERYFAVLPAAQLNLKTATLLSVRFASLQNRNPFGSNYQDAVKAKVTALKAQFKPRAKERQQELEAAAQKPLNQQQKRLDDASAKLAAAKKQVEAASHGQMQSTPEIDRQLASVKAGQAKLDAAKKQIKDQTKTTYTWQTREDLPGFTAYGDSSNRIAAIANVFPVFFFLIAALITFTTITRMVEEARGQIGTFKALGYGKLAIARNYLFYALFTGVLGAILGGVFGNWMLPRFILKLYNMYIPMETAVPMLMSELLLALLFSLIATVGAAIVALSEVLAEKPANLMRPKSPKSAKRILLERITPLWRRLSFNSKISYRNLFRYKSRMLMTIIGIAGGTALLLTGFGLRDSIMGTAPKQFDDVTHYQAMVALKHTGKTEKAKQVLQKDSTYQRSMPLHFDTAKVKTANNQVNDVTLYVPQAGSDFQRFVTLKNGSGKFSLPKSGLVISQKIADRLQLKAGQKVRLALTGGKTRAIKVAAVTENYLGVTAYMSASAYQTTFAKKAGINGLWVQLHQPSKAARNKLGKNLLKHGEALNTSFTADQASTITTMSSTMTPIVATFIVLSGVLSFVVMYNLTNINISERIRELSTIKVLGFYDGEVTMYIGRENIALTIVGIIFGFGGGWALLAFILHQAATPLVIFPFVIKWPGYVISALLMAAFTAIVMFAAHKHLQHVDMISALQSND